MADGVETVAYNETFRAAIGSASYSWSMISGVLPSGLALAQVGQTYELTGSPDIGAAGYYVFELQVLHVHNGSAGATKTFDLYIHSPTPGSLTYPLTEQDPAASNFLTSSSAQPRHYGWRFTCNTGGITVYRLGSNFPAASAGVSKTCTLWDMSGTRLGRVVTGPGTGWQWADLAIPVLLQNGSDYVVSVLTSNGAVYYNYPVLPSWMPTGDIEYVGARMSTLSTSGLPAALHAGNQQYGVVDIGYAKNLTVLSGPQLPAAAEGASYTNSIQADNGPMPYTWTYVSGNLPNNLALTSVGDEFQFSGTPASGDAGNYSFTVMVTDANNDTHTKHLTLYIAPPSTPLPFTDDFSTNKGWQYGTSWARGTATQYQPITGIFRSEPDTDSSPTADNYIAGDNIGDDYATGIASTVWLTSPPVNCSTAATVSLRFQRWLGVSLDSTAVIEVNNGSGWVGVWNSGNSTNINDTAWTYMGYDISAVAAGNAVVQVRFGIGLTSYSSATVNTGWCIDDVEIIEPAPELEVREGGLTGTIIIDNETVGGQRDFGQVGTSTNSTILTISLMNNDANTITFGTWNKTGANPGDFYVITNPPATLAPNASGIMQVQFYSTTVGVKTVTIELPHDAAYSGSTPFQINVTAEAIANTPLINVSDGSSLAHNDPATGSRDFGGILLGANSAALTITISNNGGVNLALGTPILGGTAASEYTLNLTNFASSVTAGNSTSFDVIFTPTTAGVKDANVRFTHDDTTVTSPFTINITGVGVTVAPTIEVRETDAAGIQLANPAQASGILNFGQQDINGGPTTSSIIYIENTGTAALTLGLPTFSPATANFTLDTSGFPTSLTIGASASFSITFDPIQEGMLNAVIEFTHNDGTTGTPFILNLTGEGITPEVEVREGSITGTIIASGNTATMGSGRDLGSIDISAGATGPITIVLINTGSMNLILGTPMLTGIHATDFTLDTTALPASLAAGAGTSFTVTFDPTLGGIRDAQVEFTHNDPTNPTPFIVPIIGTAVDPAGVQVTTTSLPAGTSGVVYLPAQLSAIQGTAPYIWSIYAGNLPAGLTLSTGGILSGTPSTLVASTYNFTIRVADTTGATHERQFSITVDDPLTAVGGSGAGGGGCAAVGGALALPLLLPLLIAYRRRRHGSNDVSR